MKILPAIATAVLLLQDRGQLTVQDRVTKYLDGMEGKDRPAMSIQHLLTHTSGLPDNIPGIHELLRRQTTLDEIFDRASKLSLLFAPGTQFSYSNLGVLFALRIVEAITKVPMREFLRTEVFVPLSMQETSLGLGGRPLEDIAQDLTRPFSAEPGAAYRKDLGVPWGGVYSTASDLTKFLHSFRSNAESPLRSKTVHEMLRNQNKNLSQPWGLGWMLAQSHDSRYGVRRTWRRYGWASITGSAQRGCAFGKNCSAATFGHFGVSGTLAWCDPKRDISFVLLTTKKVRHSRDGVLGPVSDLVSRIGLAR